MYGHYTKVVDRSALTYVSQRAKHSRMSSASFASRKPGLFSSASTSTVQVKGRLTSVSDMPVSDAFTIPSARDER